MRGEFSIQRFSGELLEFAAKLPAYARPVSVFGYSMGGYVAVYTALQHPELFHGVATLATKWHWTPESAAREQALLDPAAIEVRLPAFARQLADRHAPNDWKELLLRTSDMLGAMGQRPPIDATNPPGLSIPALLMVGDRDKTVSIPETLAMHEAWPGSSMGVLPDTAHPFEKVDTALLTDLIRRFLKAGK